MDWVLKHRADFGQNFEWPRKNRMHSTWVQNHLPKKSCTHSQTFPEFLGRNRNYLRRNKKIVGDNLKNVPRNRTNDESFFMKQAVGLYEHAPDYKKTCKISEKSPQNLCFQALWESHNSQQLFLNPNLGVKWRGRDCENIHTTMAESTEYLLLFLPKSILSSWTEIIWLLSSLFSFVSSIADNIENKRATRYLQENNDDRK